MSAVLPAVLLRFCAVLSLRGCGGFCPYYVGGRTAPHPQGRSTAAGPRSADT
jgi:hypothetical protein